MNVTVKQIDKYQVEINARGHRVVCDQPAENYGNDAGMTQPELFLGAIGACAMHYAIAYLSGRCLPVSGLSVRVTGTKGGHPARISAIGLQVEAPAVEPRHQQGLERAIRACLLHRTLLDPPQIGIEVATGEPAVV